MSCPIATAFPIGPGPLPTGAAFARVGREFNGHSTVNHSVGDFVTTGGFKRSNTVKNFFSILKRGVIGTYST